MAYIDTVKPWFKTGDKPTQQQFWTLFDYLRFKDDEIKYGDVSGLSDILLGKASQGALTALIGGAMMVFNADGFYDIPGGYLLEKIIAVPQANISLKIGNTAGGDDIAIEETITTEGIVYVLNIFSTIQKRIYLSGITASTQIVFFLRKVNLG